VHRSSTGAVFCGVGAEVERLGGVILLHGVLDPLGDGVVLAVSMLEGSDGDGARVAGSGCAKRSRSEELSSAE
jgi:hypothetical protein